MPARRLACLAGAALLLTGAALGQPPASTPALSPDESADLQHARALSRAFQRVARQVEPSVVLVTTYGRAPVFVRDVFGLPRQRGEQLQQTGLGSGVIVTADGHVLTNNHVIANADQLRVTLSDGRELDARLVGRDPATDLAVLRLDAAGLTPARLGDSDTLEVGEWVLAVGSPLGLSGTVTAGIVSAKGRAGLSSDSAERYEEFIQTDAAVNPGNSGGPLVNLDGEVVGINTQIATRSGGSIGISFAIPSGMARGVMDMIIQTGRTERGWLGVDMRDVPPAEARGLGVDGGGVLVRGVVDGSPADRAGLRPGDVITSFQGRRTEESNRLRNAIAFTPPGTRARLGVVRDGAPRSIDVAIIDQVHGRAMAIGATVLPTGLVAKPVDDEARRLLRYGDDVRGLLVTFVVDDSAAARAGFLPGDVIVAIAGEDVATIAEAEKALARLDPREPARVFALREGARGYILLGGE